jgi:gamma-glutamylcyclotransferase (GGCT)/AIG2-like uncharacterized protein YtfP
MPYLFAYGTLRQADVQRATFGRLLQGEDDALVGFQRSTARGHLNAALTGRPEDRIDGVVFEITDADLSSADQYEQRASFARVAGTLASGKQAWVYVDAGREELRRPRVDGAPPESATNA